MRKVSSSQNQLFGNCYLAVAAGLHGDPAEWQCVTAHALNELFPWISCLETATWLVRLGWRPRWMTVCLCACAKWTVPVNQLFGKCYLAGEAGLATPLNYNVPLRMRKINCSLESAVWQLLPGWWGWAGEPADGQCATAKSSATAKSTIRMNQLFGNCHLADEAGLATPLKDNV